MEESKGLPSATDETKAPERNICMNDYVNELASFNIVHLFLEYSSIKVKEQWESA